MALKSITEEKGAIPPDFGKSNTTLIFVTYKARSYNKQLAKQVSKKYHGAFEFVRDTELGSGKYSDLDKYPYEFRWGKTTHYMNGNSLSTNQFYIFSRKDEKEYKSPMTSGLRKKLIAAYLINLEKKRAG